LDLKTKQASVYRLRHKLTGRCDGVGHASRSSGLLHVEVSLAMVSQSGLKSAEARRREMHVALSRMLRQSQVEDGRVDSTGCVGPCYPYFTVFILLDPRGIVVI
jgi:hypothetical protein